MGWSRRVSLVWRSFQREEKWALTLCALLALLCAGMQSARPSATLPPIFLDAPSVAGDFHRTGVTSGRRAPTLRVHVAGAVNRPGVQSLAQGTRVVDAVRAAGGASRRADLHRLNLAAHLQDGAQIIVPFKGRTAGPTEQRNSERQALAPQPINVNSATAEELESLPGVGPAIARRIVEHRRRKGRFRSVQDLDAVKGIGAKKMQQLRPYVIF